jgi:Trk K+ transport system NAD-binding subunit
VRSLGDFLQVRSPRDLSRRQRLILVYAVGVICVILFYTLIYNWGMRTLEGDDHSIFRSFQTVVELMTTTGFGADAPWTTPLMNVLVVVMQLSGVVIGLFTLRVLIIPLFERTPVDLSDRLTPKDDHLVIAGYRRDSDVLLNELEQLDIDYVLINVDEDEAKRLSDAGYQVITGDPESVETLERASIRDADTVVADAGNRNASVLQTAMDLNGGLQTVALMESPSRTRALEEAGVDTIVSPHALVGRRLAHKAARAVTVPEGMPVGDDVELREVLVRRDSPLHGVTVGDSPIGEHPRLTLVAGWFGDGLRLPPSPTNQLTPNTVLLVAGPPEAIDDVHERLSGVRTTREHSEIIAAGAGEGGRAAVSALPSNVSTRTVDVVGDVSDPETLAEAGVADATALIVTVDDDATALLAIALARSLSEDIEILARVTDTDKTRTAFDAGADYVLSVQRTTARLLAREIYGEDVVSPVSQIRLVRAAGDGFTDRSLGDINRATESGWVVVGVQRDGRFRTGETAEIAAEDTLLIAGTDEMIQQFEGERMAS